jgi:hypothetical protein
MAFAGFKIVKVKDSELEAFLILELDTEAPGGAFVELSDSLTATELRGEMSKLGLPESERDFMIQKARENPK